MAATQLVWKKWNGKAITDLATSAAGSALIEVASRIVTNASQNSPAGPSHLPQSIGMSPVQQAQGTSGPGSLRVQVGFRHTAADTGEIPYGVYVEFGRRPGKPPGSDKLMGWVRFKKLVARPSSKGYTAKARAALMKEDTAFAARARSGYSASELNIGRQVSRRSSRMVKDKQEAAIRSLAYVISRAIGIQGIPPKLMITSAFKIYGPTLPNVYRSHFMHLVANANLKLRYYGGA